LEEFPVQRAMEGRLDGSHPRPVRASRVAPLVRDDLVLGVASVVGHRRVHEVAP
jgi:hypothetical protein